MGEIRRTSDGCIVAQLPLSIVAELKTFYEDFVNETGVLHLQRSRLMRIQE